jgi:hypothetical protein
MNLSSTAVKCLWGVLKVEMSGELKGMGKRLKLKVEELVEWK